LNLAASTFERLAYKMDKYCLQELLAAEQDYAPNGGTSSKDKAQYWSRRSDTEERIVAYEWQWLVYLALADEPSEADLAAAQVDDNGELDVAAAGIEERDRNPIAEQCQVDVATAVAEESSDKGNIDRSEEVSRCMDQLNAENKANGGKIAQWYIDKVIASCNAAASSYDTAAREGARLRTAIDHQKSSTKGNV
jgi:hypothetical protein